IQQGKGIWKGNTKGHMSILQKIKDYDLYITQNDQLTKQLDFEKKYRVIIPDRFGKKTMLCVWWDQKGVVYYELLKPGT
ncbi:hypothetical protein, partial [Klebsiella pneumoniae]|uniref:hypothetical protein n=1 Tax=Klebsiella pneumoniae TaxID=573 RepID=UPI0040555114